MRSRTQSIFLINIKNTLKIKLKKDFNRYRNLMQVVIYEALYRPLARPGHPRKFEASK